MTHGWAGKLRASELKFLLIVSLLAQSSRLQKQIIKLGLNPSGLINKTRENVHNNIKIMKKKPDWMPAQKQITSI